LSVVTLLPHGRSANVLDQMRLVTVGLSSLQDLDPRNNHIDELVRLANLARLVSKSNVWWREQTKFGLGAEKMIDFE
jgi:hypothetical protein